MHSLVGELEILSNFCLPEDRTYCRGSDEVTYFADEYLQILQERNSKKVLLSCGPVASQLQSLVINPVPARRPSSSQELYQPPVIRVPPQAASWVLL